MNKPGPLCSPLLMLALIGCGDRTHTDPDMEPTGPATDGPTSDPEAPLEDRKSKVADLCFEPPCEQASLPEQPELAFLEDMGDGYLRLMEAEWELAPHTEGYRCMRFTLPEEVWIKELAPQNPPGTHHVAVFEDNASKAEDGVRSCGSDTSGERRIGASGAGTKPWGMPEGVALQLAKGRRLMMQLHLFNPSDEFISGRSGMWVRTTSPEAVEHELELTLAGPLDLTVPPGRSTRRSVCTVPAATNLASIGPHMHQLGSHMRVTLLRDDAEQVLLDEDYDFFHQDRHAIDPLALLAGDKLVVECTFDNDRGETVVWGDGSLEEMCFASLAVFPPAGFAPLEPCL